MASRGRNSSAAASGGIRGRGLGRGRRSLTTLDGGRGRADQGWWVLASAHRPVAPDLSVCGSYLRSVYGAERPGRALNTAGQGPRTSSSWGRRVSRACASHAPADAGAAQSPGRAAWRGRSSESQPRVAPGQGAGGGGGFLRAAGSPRESAGRPGMGVSGSPSHGAVGRPARVARRMPPAFTRAGLSGSDGAPSRGGPRAGRGPIRRGQQLSPCPSGSSG